MKVQILTNLYPVPWAPNQASFNRQQFRILASRCPVRVTVLVSWIEILRHRRIALTPIVEGNLEVNYRGYFYVPGIARWSYALSMVLSLIAERKNILRFSPDCLLLSWAYPDGVAGSILAKMLDLPVVIKIHGSDINMHLLHAARATQILWAMKRAYRIVSVSKALANKLIEAKIPAGKLRVIYNGVDKELFRPQSRLTAARELGIGSDRKIVLFVGNLKQEKGCIDLLEAFAAISADLPEADLYYIGAGGEDQRIRDRVREHKLCARVILLGSLSHGSLAQWMNAASVLSLPSYNEGVPNVLLEAMACGTPVVATAVGGVPEVVPSQAGILVQPGDVAELSDALIKALNSEWDEDAIVDSVVNFNWDRSANELYETLENAALAYEANGR